MVFKGSLSWMQADQVATDSITQGYQSSNGNGYRGPLYDILTSRGNTLSMIGSQSSGTMPQPQNEGHDGATISQIASYTSAYHERPNVILLHAGTNDMNQPSDPGKLSRP